MRDASDALRAHQAGQIGRDELLRAILAHPTWWIALDDEGEPFVFADDAQGTELLLVESSRPEGRVEAIDGRRLVRERARDFDGLLLDADAPWAAVFRRDGYSALDAFADAVDLEEALRSPAPGQLAHLVRGPWWVLSSTEDGPPAFVRDHLVPICTGPDRAEVARRIEPGGLVARPMGGEALWAQLAGRTDYDGLAFDLHSEAEVRTGPHLARALAERREERAGAVLLPARTVAEIHRWLDFAGAEPSPRDHAVERWNGELAAIYRVRVGYRPWTVPFAVVEPTPDPDDLGAGRTRILCAGQLASLARTQLSGLPEPAARDAAQRARAADAARLLDQLLALLEGDEVPFAEIRTIDGAADRRRWPDLLTRAWLEAERARA